MWAFKVALQKSRRIRDVERVQTPVSFLLGAVATTWALALISLTAKILPGIRVSSLSDRYLAFEFWIYGTLCSFAYTFIFRSGRRSGPWAGAHFSLYHFWVSLLIFGVCTLFRWIEPSTIIDADWTLASLSLVALILVAHLTFGMIFGLLFDLVSIRDECPQPLEARLEDYGDKSFRTERETSEPRTSFMQS